MRKAGRPISTKQPAVKIEAQAEDIWGQRAVLLIKNAMTEAGWTYGDLAQHLKAELDVEMSAVALNRRINRGNFSAGFLLMCREVLQDSLGGGASAKEGVRPKGRTESISLEGIIGGWGTKAR
jgi:hypothetical protein